MAKAEVKAALDRIKEAFGEYATSEENPYGLSAYHDEGEESPWRIADAQYGESFATVEDAVEAALGWAENLEQEEDWLEQEEAEEAEKAASLWAAIQEMEAARRKES